MGYVARYRADAQEKNLPRWQEFVIAENKFTHEAILVFRKPLGYWSKGEFKVTYNEFPELPKTFLTYEEAYKWLEERLGSKSCLT